MSHKIVYNQNEFDMIVKLVKEHNRYVKDSDDEFIISCLKGLIDCFVEDSTQRIGTILGVIGYIMHVIEENGINYHYLEFAISTGIFTTQVKDELQYNRVEL